MAERAHLISLDALESFRASLLVYLSKARPTLDEVSADIVRTRNWLQHDQRTHWESQVRRRGRELEEAQQALFGARLSNLREATDAEQAAARRTRQALEEAQAKLRLVKRWSRDFDSRIEPLAKELDQLRNLLTVDLPKAVAYLNQAIKTLADYAGITAAPASPAGERSGARPPSDAPPTPGESAS